MVNNNEEFIKENINKLTVKEILKEIKISKTTYYRFIKKIGINKTSESTYNNRTKANKKNGRDLSFENIKTLSEKYFFKKDFYYNETVAYETAKKRGWLNEICKGLVETTRSYPQILLKEMLDELLNVKGSFNNWLIIKPFEIDIYYEKFGLCFEYDGYYWHRNNKNDFLKNELIKEKGLSLIRICEPEGLNENQYVNFMKGSIINFIDLINKKTKLELTKNDVLCVKIQNLNILECLGIEFYRGKNLTEILKTSPRLYRLIKKNKVSVCRKYNINDDIRQQRRFKNLNEFLIFLKHNKCKDITDVYKLEKHLKRRLEKFKINKQILKNTINNGYIYTPDEYRDTVKE